MKRYNTRCLWECMLLLLLAGIFAVGTAAERTQQDISDRLIRLHVSAASDSDADQAEKLRVRDAVLLEASSLLKEADSRNTALDILEKNCGKLAEAGKTALRDTGTPVRAEVRRELFTTRFYDSFALPGGYYDTLRVIIGPGEGRNWWCVVYPQICDAAAADEMEDVAVMGGLNRDQIAFMEQEKPEYRFRFRSVELFENLLGWFRTGMEVIPDSR